MAIIGNIPYFQTNPYRCFLEGNQRFLFPGFACPCCTNKNAGGGRCRGVRSGRDGEGKGRPGISAAAQLQRVKAGRGAP